MPNIFFMMDIKWAIGIVIVYVVSFIFIAIWSHSDLFDKIPSQIRWIPSLLLAILWPVAIIIGIISFLVIMMLPEKKKKK